MSQNAAPPPYEASEALQYDYAPPVASPATINIPPVVQQPQQAIPMQVMSTRPGNVATQVPPGSTVVYLPTNATNPCQIHGHNIQKHFTGCGICLAIFLFPCGLICCFGQRESRCSRCGAKF